MTTPPLLQPYLTDGCLVLDNSAAAIIKTCATMARYKLLDKRERAGVVAKGRGPGKAIHAGLETRYKLAGGKCPDEEQQSKIQQAVALAFGGETQPEGDEYLNQARLAEVMEMYRDGVRYEMGKDGKNGIYQFDGYADEAFDVLWVELGFAVRLGEVDSVPVIYMGRSDLGVRYRERGEVVVMDHKVGRRFDSSTIVQWSTAAGPKGYASCIPQWVAEGIEGLPLAIQKQLATYEPLRQQLAKQLPATINGFCLNAITIRPSTELARCKQPPTQFNRHLVYYNQGVLDEWRADCLEWCRTWLDWCKRGKWPMNTSHCGSFFGLSCPYLDVCNSPVEQRQLVLSTDLYQNTTWHPLDRTTDNSN